MVKKRIPRLNRCWKNTGLCCRFKKMVRWFTGPLLLFYQEINPTPQSKRTKPPCIYRRDLRKVTWDSVNNQVFSMASCKYSSLVNWNGEGSFPCGRKGQEYLVVTIAHKMGAKGKNGHRRKTRRFGVNC